MVTLIILLLLAGLITYGIFFLIFKLIWMLLKKTSNKWPLILSGISTLLFAGAIIGGICWGVYKVTTPFRQMITNLSSNTAPIYGTFNYVDDKYHFSMNTLDGLDYSDWINFGDIDAKIGVNTNIFRKDSQKEGTEPFILSGFFVVPAPDYEGDKLDALVTEISSDSNNNVTIQTVTPLQLGTNKAYKIAGTVQGNTGHQMPFILVVTQLKDGRFFYAVNACTNEKDQPNIEGLSNSLQLLN